MSSPLSNSHPPVGKTTQAQRDHSVELAHNPHSGQSPLLKTDKSLTTGEPSNAWISYCSVIWIPKREVEMLIKIVCTLPATIFSGEILKLFPCF